MNTKELILEEALKQFSKKGYDGTSMSDNVPTLLSPGEMVMNAKATQEHLPQLKAWNQDKVKHYSGGTTEDDIKNTLIKCFHNAFIF